MTSRHSQAVQRKHGEVYRISWEVGLRSYFLIMTRLALKYLLIYFKSLTFSVLPELEGHLQAEGFACVSESISVEVNE